MYAVYKIYRKKKSFTFETFCFCSISLSLGYGYTLYRTIVWNQITKQATCKPHAFVGLITNQTVTDSGRIKSTVWLEKPSFLQGYMVYVYCKEMPPLLSPGRFIHINGKAIQSTDQAFNQYLQKEYCIGTLFTSASKISIYKESNTLWSNIIIYKNELKTKVTQFLNSTAKQLFETIFLGYKGHATSEISHNFKAWGLSHMLARSGIHINTIIQLLELFISGIPLPFTIKQILLILFIIVYYVMTWQSLPIIRTIGMFLISQYLIYIRKPFQRINVLLLVFLLLLLYNPLNLLFLDFQLTFLLSAAIILYTQQTK